jgi:Zn-dependent peptidase ImmA (M78 family)
MKIPKTLKIGGMKWKVIEDKGLRNSDKSGLAVFADQTIRIDTDSSEQMKWQTLIHEIIHVLFWQGGIDIKIGNEQTEEEIVENLAHDLHQVLVDNFGLGK